MSRGGALRPSLSQMCWHHSVSLLPWPALRKLFPGHNGIWQPIFWAGYAAFGGTYAYSHTSACPSSHYSVQATKIFELVRLSTPHMQGPPG